MTSNSFRTVSLPRIVGLSLILSLGFQFADAGMGELNKDALKRLVDAAGKAHSDALVVWKDGKQSGEWYFGKTPAPIETMSITKSVASLAVGRLVTQGKLKSIDQPVCEFYPEWKQGRKQHITIRRLLTHTSGLQNVPDAGVEVSPSPDYVKLALAAELTSEPGTVFAYNNKAVNLLAGIVQKASGKRLDNYVRDEIFKPLGISNFVWMLDSAGNPAVMAGLQMMPNDLAKIGQLVLNRGKWNGKPIIDETWFDESFKPVNSATPEYGLLWWLLPDRTTFIIDDDQLNRMAARGVNAAFVEKTRRLKGEYTDEAEYYKAIQGVFGEKWQDELNRALLPSGMTLSKKKYDGIAGWSARGFLGQYLVILPKENLVVVRMVREFTGYNPKTDWFAEVESLSRRLVE